VILTSVLDAFWAYEKALMANDLEALDALFTPGAETLRGDANGVLVGHDTISGFRKGRGGAPARTILHVEVREISDVAALVIAITQPLSGGRGQQSQLWSKGPAGWTVDAAHVALPAPVIDTRVWRTIGSPLVEGGTGVLDGQTVAVKDLYALAGHRVGGGVPVFLAETDPATETADAVRLLLGAGADVQGIAQTDEFAYSIAGKNPHYGTPPNPAVVGGIPGGSSSGPASAVALGQATIGLSTDTGGSIRVPASYQGLWGLRTTHGAVPVGGLLPLAPSFDTVGWITRDAATLRAAASVSLGFPDSRDEQREIPARFVVDPALLAHAEPEVREAFTPYADYDTVELGDIDNYFETFRTVQAAEASRMHGQWIEDHPGALGADIAARFAWASTITLAQEEAARDGVAEARQHLERVIGDRVLLLPSASSAAPSTTADAAAIERTRAGTLRLTCIAGLTGRPGLSVPVMTVPQPGSLFDAPVGLCLVGPRFSDVSLIDLAVKTFVTPR
jgi:Asp-tRNA(Asn)/Glu-tRNA(Gln) amidotransferase A subunit family amidase